MTRHKNQDYYAMSRYKNQDYYAMSRHKDKNYYAISSAKCHEKKRKAKSRCALPNGKDNT